MLGIIFTILGLGFVIFLHELGHMLVARWFGVGVPKFSIGMGPRLFSWSKGATEYSLRILPLGGYVQLAGLDEDIVDEEQDFLKKPLLARICVIAAGSLVNILLGFLLIFFVLLGIGVPFISNTISTVISETAADKSGLKSGDQIVSLDGKTVNDMKKDFIDVIRYGKGKPAVVGYIRMDEAQSLTVVPDASNKAGEFSLGIQLESGRERMSFFSTLFRTFSVFGLYVSSTYESVKMLILGQANMKQLSGPVGIVQFASISFERGFFPFLDVLAMISVSLGLINLLPLPVLDGGHIFIFLLESLLGKKFDKKTLMVFNSVGVMLLVGLMVFVIFNDVKQWSIRSRVLRSILNTSQ